MLDGQLQQASSQLHLKVVGSFFFVSSVHSLCLQPKLRAFACFVAFTMAATGGTFDPKELTEAEPDGLAVEEALGYVWSSIFLGN